MASPLERKPDRISPSREAHEKALKVFTNPDNVIREIEFVEAGIYSAADVKKDLETVRKLQEVWKKERNQYERNVNAIAETLEAIILDQGELAEWFGGARTVRASMFDDYLNKTDIIAEWYSVEMGSKLLALGIDVTFSGKGIQRKIEAVRDEIDSGKLSRIKYFKDARGDFMGTRQNVPRVVIGVAKEVVAELAELWVRGDNQVLAQHPVQRLFLEQIYLQLTAMREYAQSKNQPHLANAYVAPLSIVSKLLAEKRKINLGEMKNDPIFVEITDQTARLFSR